MASGAPLTQDEQDRMIAIDALIVEAARKANAAFGRVSVGQLAAEVRMCRRHQGRRFRAVIGLPPKTFARIIRFQKALFFKRSGLSWNEIVQLCDYSDQSHFIKEIKRFSDYPPEAILNARTPSPLTRFFNGRPDMSHFYNTTYL